MKSKKVVHVTTVHQPYDVRIFHKEAVSLASAGFEVVLIACAEQSAVVKSVRIKALPKPRNRWIRMTVTVWRAYRSALEEDAEIYHFHDPELILLGILLKISGKHVIYDVHEDAAKDIHDKAYLPAWSVPILRLGVIVLEWFASCVCDHIIVATSAIARNYPPNKTTLVRNVPILGELTKRNSAAFTVRPRNVVYIGGLAPFNGVEQMVRAMHKLPQEAGIRLILAGKFNSTSEEMNIRALPGWELVDFHGWVGREEIPELFACARAGLVVYQPTPNLMECEPNKFFEVLSAGLPLIASDLPHWRDFIESHSCGIVVSPSDPEAIAKAVLDLVNFPEHAEAMGQRGQQAILTSYNWSNESLRLISVYNRIITCDR